MTIPQSPALAEALISSLSDVLSKDPEGYTRQDRDQIIATYRAQRERFAKLEKENASKPKTKKGPAGLTLDPAQVSAEDLGL